VSATKQKPRSPTAKAATTRQNPIPTTNKGQPAVSEVTDPPTQQQVATTSKSTLSAPVPDFMQGSMEEYAGAGTSARREDNLVPFLAIAQKGSPQVNKRDPAYIEGLEPGWVFDTSTRRAWNTEDGAGLLLVQAHSEVVEVEWGLRASTDKGYKGRHPIDSPIINQIRQVPKEQGRGTIRMLPNGHQLITTAYHYMIIADELRPIAIPMANSNFQVHRALNTMFRDKKRRSTSGNLFIPPSFATLLRLRTKWVSNDAGDWYVFSFEDMGYVTEEYVDAYREAVALHESAMREGVKTENPDATEETATGPAPRTIDPDDDVTDDSPL
jgi:hypothetical protein